METFETTFWNFEILNETEFYKLFKNNEVKTAIWKALSYNYIRDIWNK